MIAALIWWRGTAGRRWGRLAATAAGIATAVALLAALGSFLAGAQAAMTAHALRAVSVDWQVQAQAGGDPAALRDAISTTPGIQAALPVTFATAPSLSTQDSSTGARQRSGTATVLGLPDGYRDRFPGEIRQLDGATTNPTGALLAQQTAATLHARPGDTVTVARAGLPDVTVRVDGIVDLPLADSLFRPVGTAIAAAGVTSAAATAAPDNVLLLPAAQWHTLFDPLATVRPDQVAMQWHILLDHAPLAADPATAYTAVVGAARNLEARAAGSAQVGNNLAAVLDAARSDAAYARILFLFLAIPGAVLAAALTAAVVAAGAPRRRTEQALLRTRGATGRQVVGLALVEALTAGLPGCLVGLAAGAAVGPAGLSPGWAAVAVAVGLVIALATVTAPAVRDWRLHTVTAARAVTDRDDRAPRWARLGLDLILLAGAGAVWWGLGAGHYQLVLAPEGVSSISVSYWAFAAPALLWLGGALLAWRTAEWVLRLGGTVVAAGLRPVAGGLAPTVAVSLARRRRTLVRSVVLLAVAVAFALSTSVFNQTYRAQAEVDAALTNGADVTVTEPPGARVDPAVAGRIAALPGVRGAEPLQHRFAYVGTDLQDLYGVRADTIASVAPLRDSYFPDSTVSGALAALTARPDAVLVSAETVTDYQLRLGDPLVLRLPDARTSALTSVTFHYAGQVAEFPTAPKDSFLVANAAYVTAATGSDATGAILVGTGGGDTAAVAGRVRDLLGPGPTVTDIATVRDTVGSSLTAVDLAGLTRIELGFALLLATGAAGLVLALGLNERRRGFAITRALGGTRRHLRAFAAGDTITVLAGGLTAGIALGWVLSRLLVSVLSGVFDPPPSSIAIPWPYLGALGVALVVAISAATAVVLWRSGRDRITQWRDT